MVSTRLWKAFCRFWANQQDKFAVLDKGLGLVVTTLRKGQSKVSPFLHMVLVTAVWE